MLANKTNCNVYFAVLMEELAGLSVRWRMEMERTAMGLIMQAKW